MKKKTVKKDTKYFFIDPAHMYEMNRREKNNKQKNGDVQVIESQQNQQSTLDTCSTHFSLFCFVVQSITLIGQ